MIHYNSFPKHGMIEGPETLEELELVLSRNKFVRIASKRPVTSFNDEYLLTQGFTNHPAKGRYLISQFEVDRFKITAYGKCYILMKSGKDYVLNEKN